jgi:hypothetical protein
MSSVWSATPGMREKEEMRTRGTRHVQEDNSHSGKQNGKVKSTQRKLGTEKYMPSGVSRKIRN